MASQGAGGVLGLLWRRHPVMPLQIAPSLASGNRRIRFLLTVSSKALGLGVGTCFDQLLTWALCCGSSLRFWVRVPQLCYSEPSARRQPRLMIRCRGCSKPSPQSEPCSGRLQPRAAPDTAPAGQPLLSLNTCLPAGLLSAARPRPAGTCPQGVRAPAPAGVHGGGQRVWGGGCRGFPRGDRCAAGAHAPQQHPPGVGAGD